MPKNPIGTQKIYVTLADYTKVQSEFNRIVDIAKNSAINSSNTARENARGMAKVIQTLKLPIDIPNGF